MKRVFIVHRWDGTPQSDWYQSAAVSLKKKGFEVIIPEMPNTAKPEINAWVSQLSKAVGKPDKETYFIGHSIGCQTIMRYLEGLPEKAKVGPCLFVAGWFNLANLESPEIVAIAKPWIETKINFRKVKNQISKLTVILSSNEPYNFVDENTKIFKEKLGAKIIIEKDKGHFTEYDGVKELLIVIKELEGIAS